MTNRSLGDADHLLGHVRRTEQGNDVVRSTNELTVKRVHLVLKTVESVGSLADEPVDLLFGQRSQVDRTTVDDLLHHSPSRDGF